MLEDQQNPYQNFDDPTAPGAAPGGAPGASGPVTSDADPRLNNPRYASDPNVLAWLNRPGGPGDTNPATMPKSAPKATETGPTTDPGPTTLNSLIAPYDKTFQAPPMLDLGGQPGLSYIPPAPTLSLPGFQKPPAWSYADFQLPSADQVLANDPGEAFRLKLGTDSITNNAAAQGTVRGGATLQNLVKFGQDYGTSEYGAAADRAFNTYSANRANSLGMYNTNYQTQYVDPYNFNVQAAKDMFAPKEQQWETLGTAGQRQNELNFSQGLDAFNTNFNVFKYNQQWPYTVLSDQQRLGLQAAGA